MRQNSIYKYLFFFTVAFYCFILSQFGLENFDTGYIPSFSWRIINGQIVYSDFIYKGPPLTLYFHALFMKILPQAGQFFFIRLLCYFFFALQVFFVVSGFDNCFTLSKYKIDKWGAMSVCFIISLLNFSPYPWPTTDGLLFASIAFWLISRYKIPRFPLLFAIAVFSVLSALTKQSFYLVPVFFLFWVFLHHGWKKALIFASFVFALVAVFLGLIFYGSDFEKFLHQTTGQTTLYLLFYTGFHNYIFIPVFWFAMVVGLGGIAAFFYVKMRRSEASALLPLLKWLSITVFAISVFFALFRSFQIASTIAFDACLIAVLFAVLKGRNVKELTPIFVALAIAWSASISQGYPFPILFATGIILSFMLLIGKDSRINPKWYFWIAVPVCLTAFSYNWVPYRERKITELNYSLENISPKLKYIRTNKDYFEKYSELKSLVKKYGENFIVAPNIPMANYLFNDQSELPADWLIESEVDKQQDRFIKLAAQKKNYIFMEKSFLDHEQFVPPDLKKFSSISYFIYKNFNRIEETRYFLVFNALKKDERLP